MKVTCRIVQDLLPLYADEACTGDSRRAVEEHLETCAACRHTLDAMRAELHGQERPRMQKEDFAVKRALSKIRRRWILSLVCVIIAIPLVCLGVNEIRGRGIAFTNITQPQQSREILMDLAAKDYEKVFETLNVEAEFQRLLQEELPEQTQSEREYESVVIGEETYYHKDMFSDQQIAAAYQSYLKDGDAAAFWRSVALYRNGVWLLPQETYLDALRTGDDSFLLDRLQQERVSVVEIDGRQYAVLGSSYHPWTLDEEVCVSAHMSILPEEIYEKMAAEDSRQLAMRQEIVSLAETDYDAAYERYYAIAEEKFLHDFEKLDGNGLDLYPEPDFVRMLRVNNDEGIWSCDWSMQVSSDYTAAEDLEISVEWRGGRVERLFTPTIDSLGSELYKAFQNWRYVLT